MQWDDFSFFGGDSADFGGGLGDYGSFDPTSYDMGASQDMGTQQYGPAFTGGTTTDILTAGGQPGQQGQQQGMFGGLGAPGGMGLLQGGLGLAGGLAGLIGTLTGGGGKGTQMPVMGTAQKAAVNQAGQALQPAAMGQLPLQQMQAGFLQALMSGQIPPQFAALVNSAYDPARQNLATQATNAGRQAGFYDAPLSSPPGGAIMGPGLAQLQGQQANSLLALMQSFPQLLNQPINSQIGAAQGMGGQLLQGASLGTGQQASAPLGPQIGAQLGSGLQGISQTLGQNQQNQMLNQILQRQQQGQGGISFSGQSYP